MSTKSIKEENQEVLNNFLIEMILISPIEKILDQLKNGEYRDCDVKWLNDKLKNYTDFAMDTMGMDKNLLGDSPMLTHTKMNKYCYEKFTEYFTTLLKHFKNIIES